MKTTREKKLKILCPHCSHKYSAKMEEQFEQTLHSCPSGGIYTNELSYRIEIICSNCKKVVYVKEGFKDFDE